MKASLPYKYITSVKNGKYYVVFDYKDASNKRKRKWVTTGLPEKCSKKALKAKVDEIAHDFEENFIKGAEWLLKNIEQLKEKSITEFAEKVKWFDC